jgi:hypothetical protein
MTKRIRQAKLPRTIYEKGWECVPFSVRNCSQNCLKCSRSAVELHKHCSLVDSSLKFLNACCRLGCFSHLTWDASKSWSLVETPTINVSTDVEWAQELQSTRQSHRLLSKAPLSYCWYGRLSHLTSEDSYYFTNSVAIPSCSFSFTPSPGRQGLAGSTLHKQKQCNLFNVNGKVFITFQLCSE